MAKKNTPSKHRMRKNKAALLAYWLCATDEKLLDAVLKRGKAPLVKRGIPARHIHKVALRNIKDNERILRLFSEYIIERGGCPDPPCAMSSLNDLTKEIVGVTFAARTPRKKNK
jgi:hypothetical protein